MRPSDRPATGLAGRAAVLASCRDGWRRVFHAPGVVVTAVVTMVALAAIAGSSVTTAFRTSVLTDPQLGTEHADVPVEPTTWRQQMAATATAEILGGTGTVAAALALSGGILPSASTALSVLVPAVVWVVFSGGILVRLARRRARAPDPPGFAAACRAYAGRLGRLGVLTGLAYWVLFRLLAPRVSMPGTDGAPAWLQASAAVVFAAVLIVMGAVVDLARVRVIVEDRRSMIGALVSSARFVRRRIWRVAGLYLVNVGLAVAVSLPWLAASAWSSFAAVALYLGIRVIARLAFVASEIAFVEAEFERAGTIVK